MNLDKLRNIVLFGPTANNLYQDDLEELETEWQEDIEEQISSTEESLWEDFGAEGMYMEDLFGRYGENWRGMAAGQRDVYGQYYDAQRKYTGAETGGGWFGRDLIME